MLAAANVQSQPACIFPGQDQEMVIANISGLMLGSGHHEIPVQKSAQKRRNSHEAPRIRAVPTSNSPAMTTFENNVMSAVEHGLNEGTIPIKAIAGRAGLQDFHRIGPEAF